MKHRNPLAVFFLALLTFGIYDIVWHVKTKNELNRLGANIPTAWLIIVPLANLYWLWKYSQGVEQVSNGKISAVMSLVLLLLLSIVGLAILQSMYNDLGSVQAATAGPPQTMPPAAVGQAPAPSPTAVPAQPVAPPPSPSPSPNLQDINGPPLPPQSPSPPPPAL